jgi:polysaccharide biosynthesis protein PslA
MLLDPTLFNSDLPLIYPAPAGLPRSDQARLRLPWWQATLILLDVVGVIVLSVAIFDIYPARHSSGTIQFLVCPLGFLVAWGLASHAQGLYSRNTILADRRILMARAVRTCGLAFGLVLLLAFGFNFIDGVSRVWLLVSVLGAVLWVVATHLLFRRRLQSLLRSGYCFERALVLSDTTRNGHHVREALETEARGEIRVVAVLAIRGSLSAPGFAPVEAQIRSGTIDRVFVAGFDEQVGATNALLGRLSRLAVNVTLLPNVRELRAPLVRVDRIGVLPALGVACKPLSPLQVVIKRAEDLVLGSILLALAAPTMLLVALAIRLDSKGPIFFRQVRLGFHDKAFRVWKFRTMYAEAADAPILRQTSRDDPRVTRVGHILRRTSLDELPQLFNVLSGEMSIVGPRPHAKSMTTAGLPLHTVLEGYSSRHRIKPGITGWAQVNGCRGEVNTEDQLRQRVDLDCYYIENWSILMDAWIILKTIVLVIFDKGAY